MANAAGAERRRELRWPASRFLLRPGHWLQLALRRVVGQALSLRLTRQLVDHCRLRRWVVRHHRCPDPFGVVTAAGWSPRHRAGRLAPGHQPAAHLHPRSQRRPSGGRGDRGFYLSFPVIQLASTWQWSPLLCVSARTLQRIIEAAVSSWRSHRWSVARASGQCARKPGNRLGRYCHRHLVFGSPLGFLR